MAHLDNAIQKELLDLLTPLLTRSEDRRGLLALALGVNCPLVDRIDYSGAVQPFILRMLPQLVHFGELKPSIPALWAVLETVREQVGVDRQRRIDRLRPLLQNPRMASSLPSAPVTPAGQPMPLQVFLASPGDVADERALALKVLEQLQYDPLLRDRITIKTVAWDKPGAGTPMLATLTPQAAIAQGLPKPSQCDIVVVVLWSRMGTPLPPDWKKPDGSPYLSGTEWEYLDALQAAKQHGRPDILVYRCNKKLLLDPDEEAFEEKTRQRKQVNQFFSDFKLPDGSSHGGYNAYDMPDDFRNQLNLHLRELVRRRLEAHPRETVTELATATVAVTTAEASVPLWEGSPFPGLRPFTDRDAPIFFGRGRETHDLIERLKAGNRFTAVIGASGSGKSSLVWAGLIPRLKGGSLEGSADWQWLRFTPGEIPGHPNPFAALALSFKPVLDHHGRSLSEVTKSLEEDPATLDELIKMALEETPPRAELMLFIDQFEELFTLVPCKQTQRAFTNLLARAANTERLRVVVTLRADFYHRCLDWEALSVMLRTGSYPLAAPGLGTLFEMITGPAERAGLTFDKGLVAQLLEDTGSEPGALALLAFALAELYEHRGDNRKLTWEAYKSFGGVQQAIAQRAETLYRRVGADECTLTAVFRELVEVDEGGTATRRRAPLAQVTESSEAVKALVKELTDGRLLVGGHDETGTPTLEVAHEALFRTWGTLKDWIEKTADDHRLRRQIKQLAEYWDTHERNDTHRWPDDRVVEVVDMCRHLHLEPEDFSERERDFLGPLNWEKMRAQLDEPATPHEQRAIIGVRLSLLGDPRSGVGLRVDGLPDIAWREVPEGEVTLEEDAGTCTVEPFYIAKHPVTYIQYQAFIRAHDGFHNDAWWQGLGYEKPEKPGRQFNRRDNHPAENVAWVEAVAFCRWLSAKLGYEIRLPTEWQWQQAATGGDSARHYPWDPDEWGERCANTYESDLSRSTAVGMYPNGVSPVGALDMAGNVWEWCLNEYENPDHTDLSSTANRVVRGGSWLNGRAYARAAYRYWLDPGSRNNYLGFRVVCSSPIL